MNIKEVIIHTGDLVFASLVQGGREIASLRFTGVGSIADIVAYLRRTMTGCIGPVVMKLRNFNQGWSVQHTLMLQGA